MSHSLDELLSLAQKQFGQLTNAEKKLFYAIAHDEVANFQTGIEKLDRPIKAKHWEAERTLKADRIVWLVTNEAASKFISFRGLRIIGAKIEGEFNLEYAEVKIPLGFVECAFTNLINLHQAKLRAFYLSGTHVNTIQACQVRIEDSLHLNQGFVAKGEVSLRGAVIEGDLNCTQGKIVNPKGIALNANQTRMSGGVYLGEKFIAKGEVCLLQTSIGGILQCGQGQFYNPKGKALNAGRANITGSVFLRNQFKAKGEVSLLATTIGGGLDCAGGQFLNSDRIALSVFGSDITLGVFLGGEFRAEGEVSLSGASIGGDLNCTGGQFFNPGGTALSIFNADITDNVVLEKQFRAEGEVSLLGTAIGGQLTCVGGQFFNPGGVALNLDMTSTIGGVFLRGQFKAEGEVRLTEASVGGTFNCARGQFLNPGSVALNAEGANIEGSVWLRDGFQANGMVNFANARIDDILQIAEMSQPNQMALNLSFAKVGTLSDAEESWMAEGNLYLNGFTYNALDVNSPLDGKRRLKWIRLQPDDEYALQPYEQLAAVLRASGHQQAATEILIGKEEDRRRYGGLSPLGKAWNWFLGVTIAHGYRPEKALYYSLPLIMLGALLFGQGYQAKLISETVIEPYAAGTRVDPNLYPAFNPVLYSIDVFLPVIDFHQETYWIPNPSRVGEVDLLLLKTQMSGRLLLYYFWLQIVAGWVLTSLWIAGFTGLVRSQQ